MSLTYQQFYYGLEVTSSNKYLDFDEGGTPYSAVLKIGSYTYVGLQNEIARAMNAASLLSDDYSASMDRTTRITTIEKASGTFSILGATGSYSGQSILSVIGFAAVDTSAAATHSGTSESGESWNPQFPISNYIPFNENIKAADSSVNKSVSGETESFTFGTESFMSGEFLYMNDGFSTNSEIKNDATGRQKAIDFFTYAIGKKKLEFMYDETDPNTFTACLLESTSADSKGTGFRFDRMRGLDTYKRTGKLVFREI